MFKQYFEQVENVAIWPIISLTIFFIFFIGLIIYVVKINKGYIKHMAKLPLIDDQEGINSVSNSKLENHG
ncbi:MAG: cytochrome c oxidase cbb3-type subunit 4 [Roseivirga sp.]|jgi:cytochrome c oxidase cbb3-type subunit 4